MSSAADLPALDASLQAILSPDAEIRGPGEVRAPRMLTQAGEGGLAAVLTHDNEFVLCLLMGVCCCVVCGAGGMPLFLEYLNHSEPAAHLRKLAGVLLKKHVGAAWDSLDMDTKQALLQTASTMLDAAEKPIQNTAVR